MKSFIECVMLDRLLCKALALGIVCILTRPVAPSVFSSSGSFIHDKMAYLVEVIRQHQSHRDLVISNLWIKLWCVSVWLFTCQCVQQMCVRRSLIRNETLSSERRQKWICLNGRCVPLSHWCVLLATVPNRMKFVIFSRRFTSAELSWCQGVVGSC